MTSAENDEDDDEDQGEQDDDLPVLAVAPMSPS